MKSKHETPLALAMACLLLSGAAVLAAGIGEAFDPEPPGMYWVDPGPEQDSSLRAEPAWQAESSPSPDEVSLPGPKLVLPGSGELGFLPPASPDDAPPWPESGAGGLFLDGVFYSPDDAPNPAPPLGI